MKATRLLRLSWDAILVIIPLPEVPELFSSSSSVVHDVTILFQHFSVINVVISEATGGGDRVNFSQILANLFPYDDATYLST